MISIYNRLSEIEINARRAEALDKWGKIVQYGRANPVWFIENILGCQLLDYQKYMVLGGWTAKKSVYVQSRASGKSFTAGLIAMSKSMLYPNNNTYIMAPTGRQSLSLFEKIRDIATGGISSVAGNDVFINELIKATGSDGFTMTSGDPHIDLFNGSSITSLNGASKNLVSIRAQTLIYDEAGKLPHEFFALTEPFITVNSDFRTGVDLSVYPQNVPNQAYYFSSAEDTNSYLYHLYKTGTQHMMMGLKDYFVCDVTCEMPLHPTVNGKLFPVPLLTQTEIDDALRANEYKARREYYNIFDVTGGVDCVVGADAIFRNEKSYKPKDGNNFPEKGHKFAITIDPAHQVDNSFALVTEFWEDPERGWMGKIVNGYNMIKVLPNGEKKLYTTPEAVEFIRELMRKYNGPGEDWDNIILFVDPGSGGQGLSIADYLRSDFRDKFGRLHHGVIDLNDEKSAMEKYNFPNAVPGVLHLYSPQKFKNSMFEAMHEMIEQDLVQFTPPCPRGETLYFDDGTSTTLTRDESRALTEIDLLKTEIKLIRKQVTDKGNIRYGLPPSLDRKVHDDRAYTTAAMCFLLSNLRKDTMYAGKPKDMNFIEKYGSSKPTCEKKQIIKKASPFTGKANPFVGRRKW